MEETIHSSENKDWIRIEDKTYRQKRTFFINTHQRNWIAFAINIEKEGKYLEVSILHKKKVYRVKTPKEVLLKYLVTSKAIEPTSETFNKFICDNNLY